MVQQNRTSSRSRTDLSNAPAAMVSMNPPASGPPQIGYGWSYVDAPHHPHPALRLRLAELDTDHAGLHRVRT